MNKQFHITRSGREVSAMLTCATDAEAELAQERLEELVVLMQEAVLFDIDFEALPEARAEVMVRAVMAMRLKLDLLLAQTAEHAAMCRRVVDGSVDISELGFPEFSE